MARSPRRPERLTTLRTSPTATHAPPCPLRHSAPFVIPPPRHSGPLRHSGEGRKSRKATRNHIAQSPSHYVRDGRVVFELIAQRSQEGTITSICRGIRYGLKDFAPFFAVTSAGDRKPIYEGLRVAHNSLPPWKSLGQAEAEVRALEAKSPELHVELPSEVSAYGATGPLHLLRKHIDWIYIPAVKDASAEATEQRNSAFQQLILLAVRTRFDFAKDFEEIRANATNSIQEVIDNTNDILKEVGAELDRDFKNLTATPIDVLLVVSA